jgi:hypothetical protein
LSSKIDQTKAQPTTCGAALQFLEKSFNTRRDETRMLGRLAELAVNSFEILKCKSMTFHNPGIIQATLKVCDGSRLLMTL